MSRRRAASRRPPEMMALEVEDLAHDGRGVARLEGKTVFVDGALPGEQVEAVGRRRRRHFDEASTTQVLSASPQRVTPRCAHFGVCGGCALQHLEPAAQLSAKQDQLAENLERLGSATPQRWLPPLAGPVWGYRRKARLGVKFVHAKGRVLVGFRERHSRLLADLQRCEVLHPAVGEKLTGLAALIAELEARESIPQLEVAVSETGTGLIVRHLKPLSDDDRRRLRTWGERGGVVFYLQPGGPDSVVPLTADCAPLTYTVDEPPLVFQFRPDDFTQINFELNRVMVAQALDRLQLAPPHRVLDLFCGLGNFSLPLARRCAEVVAVEGDPGLVERARANARRNHIANVAFHSADLSRLDERAPWWQGGFDAALLDPPRTGAREVLGALAARGVPRLVYVSCHPATLARDAGALVNELGYRLLEAGVMDMFPHTGHVESMAVFERR